MKNQSYFKFISIEDFDSYIPKIENCMIGRVDYFKNKERFINYVNKRNISYKNNVLVIKLFPIKAKRMFNYSEVNMVGFKEWFIVLSDDSIDENTGKHIWITRDTMRKLIKEES